MKAKEYYAAISQAAQTLFDESVDYCDFLGKIHDYSASIQDWLKVIPSSKENHMLDQSLEQVEFSCLLLLCGMYRQAFASLRLALELLFGAIYFSAHKLDYLEWENGTRDLTWQTVIDENSGVISKRFSNAFFPELSIYVEMQHKLAKALYRQLSEFVHGNYSTWNRQNPKLSINEKLIEDYKHKFDSISSLAHFLLSLRYLKEVEKEKLYKIESHVMDKLQHIAEIRFIFGGAVEDK